MNTREIINFWLEQSERDFKVAKNLFNSKYYAHSLFFGHLSLEKLFKAVFIKIKGLQAPYSHDLLFLAQKAEIELNKKQKEELNEISTFNVRARYDNIKLQFYKKANKIYAAKWFKIIDSYRLWLKKNYLKSLNRK